MKLGDGDGRAQDRKAVNVPVTIFKLEALRGYREGPAVGCSLLV